MFDFGSRRVLVVGGSSGLGLAAAIAFAKSGASVTIASRSQDKVDKAVAVVGSGCEGATLDTRDEAQVSAFFEATAPWDHVVVSAAQTPMGPVRQLPMVDAFEAMQSKFWGAYRVARAARLNAGGSLTLVGGGLAIRPRKGAALLGAINAGLEGLTRGLALELAPIRVNLVSPGIVDTPLFQRLPEAARQGAIANAQANVPVGRIGAADDIANAVLYLAGTGYATGSVVLVDGGGTIA